MDTDEARNAFLELDRILGELAENCTDKKQLPLFERLDAVMERVQKLLYPEGTT